MIELASLESKGICFDKNTMKLQSYVSSICVSFYAHCLKVTVSRVGYCLQVDIFDGEGLNELLAAALTSLLRKIFGLT